MFTCESSYVCAKGYIKKNNQNKKESKRDDRGEHSSKGDHSRLCLSCLSDNANVSGFNVTSWREESTRGGNRLSYSLTNLRGNVRTPRPRRQVSPTFWHVEDWRFGEGTTGIDLWHKNMGVGGYRVQNFIKLQCACAKALLTCSDTSWHACLQVSPNNYRETQVKWLWVLLLGRQR